jgi:hypothetical protein
MISRVATLTECRECQDREFTRVADEARAAHQAAEAARQAEQEHADSERQQHAAKVAAREAQTGWPQTASRVAWLSVRINNQEPRRPATAGHAAGAALVAGADLVVLATLCVGMSAQNGEQAALALLVFFALLWPSGWALWISGKLVRQHMRDGYINERDELMRLRGCGDPFCARCEVT